MLGGASLKAKSVAGAASSALWRVDLVVLHETYTSVSDHSFKIGAPLGDVVEQINQPSGTLIGHSPVETSIID